MNILVTSPFTPVSSNIHSHRAAQAAIYAEQLSVEFGNVHLDRTGDIHPDPESFNLVYAYHGNDWFGSLNLFGGMKNYGNSILEVESSYLLVVDRSSEIQRDVKASARW